MLEMQAMATESFIFSIQVDMAQYFGFRALNMKKKKQKKNRDLTKIKLSICLTLDIVEFTFHR